MSDPVVPVPMPPARQADWDRLCYALGLEKRGKVQPFAPRPDGLGDVVVPGAPDGFEAASGHNITVFVLWDCLRAHAFNGNHVVFASGVDAAALLDDIERTLERRVARYRRRGWEVPAVMLDALSRYTARRL